MRLIRYRHDNRDGWGIEREEWVHALDGDLYGAFAVGERVAPLSAVQRLAPWPGGKVLAFALNYPGIDGAVADRDVEPLIFLKGPNTVIGPEQPIRFDTAACAELWIEVELAFVVSRHARNVTADEAQDCILGHTIANDVTARNVMGRDHHLARSKSLDTFCPLGPWIETGFDSADVALTSRINGGVVQHGSTAERFCDDARALSLLSRLMTLEPGDIVLTGTPEGAGPGNRTRVKSGDIAELQIEGLGTLRNPVVAD